MAGSKLPGESRLLAELCTETVRKALDGTFNSVVYVSGIYMIREIVGLTIRGSELEIPALKVMPHCPQIVCDKSPNA